MRRGCTLLQQRLTLQRVSTNGRLFFLSKRGFSSAPSSPPPPSSSSSSSSRLSAPSEKRKRLDHAESLAGLFVSSLGLFVPRTRLPLLRASAQPARAPLLGTALLCLANLAGFVAAGAGDTLDAALLPSLLSSLSSESSLVVRVLAAPLLHSSWPSLVVCDFMLALCAHRLWRAVGAPSVAALYFGAGWTAAAFNASLAASSSSASDLLITSDVSLVAVGVASAVLLSKDRIQLGLFSLPLPIAVFLTASGAVEETGIPLLAGAAAWAALFIVLRRRWLFAFCPHIPDLAERHVSYSALAAVRSADHLDLSYARSPRSWSLLRHRGLFLPSDLPPFASRLILDGCSFGVTLSPLPSSLVELVARHASLVVKSSDVTQLPLLRTLVLSGSAVRMDGRANWPLLMSRLRELELHLNPDYCAAEPVAIRVLGVSPLERLSIDGPKLVIERLNAPHLSALHLGPGCQWLCPLPPVLEALGICSPDALHEGEIPPTVSHLYLRLAANDSVSRLVLPPMLKELVLDGATSAQIEALLFSSALSNLTVLRLIDCNVSKAVLRRLPRGVQVLHETSETEGNGPLMWLWRKFKKVV